MTYGLTIPKSQLINIGGIPTTDLATGYSGLGLTMPTDTTGLGLTAPTSTWGNPDWAGGNLAKIGTGTGTGSNMPEFGWNLDTMKVGTSALSAIGGLFNAFQANKLARDQFNLTKEVTNTNLNNQIKGYNTTLEDRALARARLNGDADPAAYAAAYTGANRLTRG